MSKYIHFTEEQKDRARKTDLVSMLERSGEILKKCGKDYIWNFGSQKLLIRGNLWYLPYEQVGGNTVDFLCRFMDMDYPEAMQYLLGDCSDDLPTALPIEKEHGVFELPPKNADMRRVFAYLLNTRGLDREVVIEFVQNKMIYESADHHNAVFVGYDKNGIARHVSMRGTFKGSTFKGSPPYSLPEYSFHWHGTSQFLFFFEAPIDMLSFISMHKENWQQHSYAAACSVSDRVLFQMLKDNPNIRKVTLCLDNDEAGQTANRRIAEKLTEQGFDVKILIPARKDWNEDRLAAGGYAPRRSAEFFISNEEREEGEEPCQVLQL